MDIQRVLDRYDSLMRAKEFAPAESHLKYWLEEAAGSGDHRSAFAIQNELVGFYRMQGKKDRLLTAVDILLTMTDKYGLNNKTGGGTAYINAATAYKSIDMPQNAFDLYKRAYDIYETELDPFDVRRSALYNNMALTLLSLDDLKEAEKLFDRALIILENNPGTENEQAITWLNKADLTYYRFNPGTSDKNIGKAGNAADDILSADSADAEVNGKADRLQDELEIAETIIEEYVCKADSLLQRSFSVKNPGFVFTAEKCIPAFRFHGYFVIAARLEREVGEVRI